MYENLIEFDRAALSSLDGSCSIEINNVRAQWYDIEWDEPSISDEQIQQLGTLFKMVGMATSLIGVISLEKVSGCQLIYSSLQLVYPNRALAVMQVGDTLPYRLVVLAEPISPVMDTDKAQQIINTIYSAIQKKVLETAPATSISLQGSLIESEIRLDFFDGAGTIHVIKLRFKLNEDTDQPLEEYESRALKTLEQGMAQLDFQPV